MCPAIDKTMSQITPKITALLRTRAYYDLPNLIGQFKTHIWGIMEANSGGIFHACTSQLDRFDHCQQHFVEKLGSTEEAAFINNNFAPPVLRRNIGILGMLHKRVLGLCHQDFRTASAMVQPALWIYSGGQAHKTTIQSRA